jgi:hypothetical protein
MWTITSTIPATISITTVITFGQCLVIQRVIWQVS